MQTRVDTTLHKELTITVVRAENGQVCFEVRGTGRLDELVVMVKGDSLTFDIPLEVHIGW